MTHNLFNTRQQFKTGKETDGVFYSLPQLEREGIGNVSRLPISIRIVLESVLRNFDGGKRVSEASVRALAGWQATDERTEEIPFVVARVILQDFTGVPLLVDLAVSTFNTDVPEPAIEEGLKLAVVAYGRPDTVRATALLNPFEGVTEM